MINLRILTPDDWRLWREMRLEALRNAPEVFSATLADWQGKGDAQERWRNRLTAVAFNGVAELDGKPAGMISGGWNQGNVELLSLWVTPAARGQGVGDRLVEAVVKWARSQGSPQIILSVKTGNVAATRLYLRHDFSDVGPSPESKPESPERLFIRGLDMAQGHPDHE